MKKYLAFLVLFTNLVHASINSTSEQVNNSTTSKELLAADEILFEAPVDPTYQTTSGKKISENMALQKEDEEDLDDDLYFDDFSDLGINVKDLLNEKSKDKKSKDIKISDILIEPQPQVKKVDISLLQLSCDEFSGRLAREAFSACSIASNEYKNSKIELTIDETGRITSYDNSLVSTDGKKLCLSGYVARQPVKNVGANFTCRVYFQ